ncbi:DUF6074 family protein [Aureimonas frigidaquae]|uniref:Uncharacterized protein n=1 Tax=Aureimonas frigidaquae TaxID=424757 RepID=A0A0P0Z3N3_9HYPH|nr:DUF6074 family protein [Aureimonas frigidaquae]BAT28725.1 hypothetical protein [Aureimonas frigidaquae]
MQPDLFQPTVIVIPFPARMRVGHIRRTADRIVNSRTDREAAHYWKRAVEGLWRQMEKAGVPENRIEVEVNAFACCVQAEVTRISMAGTGGAA